MFENMQAVARALKSIVSEVQRLANVQPLNRVRAFECVDELRRCISELEIILSGGEDGATEDGEAIENGAIQDAHVVENTGMIAELRFTVEELRGSIKDLRQRIENLECNNSRNDRSSNLLSTDKSIAA